MAEEKRRYPLIDGIRGIAIVNMILFHFCYDVFVIYGEKTDWPLAPEVRLWQQAICWTFILVSGFVWRWGKRTSLRRGIFLNLCGFLVSLVTFLAIPGEAIWFGILNFMGCAVLLMIPLDRFAKKVPPAWGMLVCFALFFLFQNVQRGYLGPGDSHLFAMPRALYELRVLTPLGFPFPGFASSDFFPVLPWMFLYLCGYFFHGIFERHEGWKRACTRDLPVLSAIGRKSVLIYLLHQPLCMLLCGLMFR